MHRMSEAIDDWCDSRWLSHILEFQHYVLKKFLVFPSSFFAAYLLAFYVWHSKFFWARMHHVDRPRGWQKIFISLANFSHFKTVSQFPSRQKESVLWPFQTVGSELRVLTQSHAITGKIKHSSEMQKRNMYVKIKSDFKFHVCGLSQP